MNTGEVSSSNFTTLYNASGLAVPNAGAGQITGNLNVGGNLTVQGSTLLVGEVTLQNTLSLPNYTFPLPDGTTDQVMTTDGNGNLTWVDVTAIPGADYNISATTATGGANITLANTAGFTDSVKLAAGSNMNIVRTDANTITISTVADNIPDGTANGQMLVWENSAWTATNDVASDTLGGRFRATFKNSSAGVNNVIFTKKDFGATAYTTGDGSGIAFQLDSDSQAENTIGVINTSWHPSTPQITLATNINQNTLGPFVTVGGFTSAQATFPGDLAVNGGDITTTQTTASVFNTTATTVNAFGAATAVNIGNSAGTVTVNGDLAVLGNDIKSSTGSTAITLDNNSIVVAGDVTVNGQDIKSNGGTTAITLNGADVEIVGDLTVTGNDIKKSGGTTVITFSGTNLTTLAGDLQVNGNTIRGSAGIDAIEINGADISTGDITLNGGDIRSSGGTVAVSVSGANATVAGDLSVNGGNINLNGTATAGVQPFLTFATQAQGVNPLYGIRGQSSLDDPWFIGAGGAGTDQGYIEIATGDNAGESNSGGQIYVRQYGGGAAGNSVPWKGGTAPVVNELILLDNLGNTSIPHNLAVNTNTLFVDAATGRVGVGTNTPSYTLDVQGDVGISGDIYVSGVHVDLTTPVHQGQLLYVSNDVTPTITNSSTINFATTTYRPNFQALTGTAGRTQAGAIVSNNTGATPYTTADGGSLLMGVDSDSQALNTMGSISTSYNASGDHQIRLSTSTNNFANDQATSITGGNTLVFPTAHGFSIGDKLSYAGPTQNGLTYNTAYYVISAGFTTTQCQISATLGGSALALTNGTGLSLWFYNAVKRLITSTSASTEFLSPTLLLNATNTGIPFTGTAGLEVERGTTGANQTFAWNETYDFWNASGDLYADNYVIGGQGLATNGNNIFFNNEGGSPSGDCFVTVKDGVSLGVSPSIKWNDTTKRWQDTTDGSTYLNLPNQNLDTTSSVSFSQVTLDALATLDTSTLTTTSTATVALNLTTRNVLKCVVSIVQGSNVHCVEALLLRTGATTAMLTTYGEMYNTTPLAAFSADVSGADMRLLVTPTSATSTVFGVVRTSLT